MTIVINPTTASALSTAGTSNNPIILWDNLGAGGTWSTDLGTEINSAAYAGTGTTFDQWKATVHASGDAAIEVDLGSAQDVSFVAIAAHNAADIAATMTTSYSATGLAGSWTSPAAATIPTDNQAIGWYFPAVNARYWRVYFNTATAGQEAIAGVVFVGNPLTVEQRIYQGYKPPITPTEVALQSNVSEGGHLLGSSMVKKASTASASFTHILPTTFRGASWKAFQNHFNAGGGFFWAWRPTKYGDFYYAWRSGSALAPENMGIKDYMSATLEMRLYDEP